MEKTFDSDCRVLNSSQDYFKWLEDKYRGHWCYEFKPMGPKKISHWIDYGDMVKYNHKNGYTVYISPHGCPGHNRTPYYYVMICKDNKGTVSGWALPKLKLLKRDLVKCDK